MTNSYTDSEHVLQGKPRAQYIWAMLKSYMLDECSLECASISNADEKNLINLILYGLCNSAPAPDQAWRDSGWLALSASEKAGYHWPEDSDLHRQCRSAYVAGATDYSTSPHVTDGAPAQGPTEPLQCLRCGTVDAFGPASKDREAGK